MKLDELEKLEHDFLANIQHRRKVIHEHLAALDKDEAEGREAFRILRQKVSHGGEESILKAMQSPFQTGSLMDEMQTIIPSLTGPFDINTIREVIEGKNPTIRLNPTSVSNNLRKLNKLGLIDLVTPGKGNKTSTYKISEKWLAQLKEEEIEKLPVPDLLFRD